jgi:hypothetical protein
VIDISIEGLDDVMEALRRVPTSLDRETVFADVSQRFSARLRAATPKGYSGQLRDSVVFSSDAESGEVGYEPGVETSGDSSLDSALRPRTRGRSVLKKWVKPEELESVLEETFDAYAPEGVKFMSTRFSEELSRGIS